MQLSAHGDNFDPNVIHACVNANSGEVQIVEPDQECRRNWTPVHWGLEGPQGEPGEPGEQGPPGGLALAGQTCPTPQSVIGVDQNGNVICSCGNGFLNEGEQCDDGNTADADGCSPACTRSPSEKHGWRVFGGMMGPAQ